MNAGSSFPPRRVRTFLVVELLIVSLGTIWYAGASVVLAVGLKQTCSSCGEVSASSCRSCELMEGKFYDNAEKVLVSYFLRQNVRVCMCTVVPGLLYVLA